MKKVERQSASAYFT